MQNNSQNILCTIRYTIVHRSIQDFVQKQIPYNYTLELTEIAIISNQRTFKLNRLFDISYKPFTNGQGFLYLHTDEGLFSFVISSDPTQFIQTCRSLIS